MLRESLRKLFNRLVSLIPSWMLTGFFKTFLSHPERAEAAGFHVHPCRFDSPLPLMWEVNWDKLDQRRSLPGIDFRERNTLEFLAALGKYGTELDAVPCDSDGVSPFWFNNATFTDFDAAALHSILRYRKPKRYVELGCGWSSFISSHALARNERESSPCDAIYADPVPRRDLRELLATGRLLETRVQELPLQLFTALEPGDVLFIDTSHVLKLQSDVEHELLRILPSLKPGVWIHFHDVFSPYDYPEDCVRMPVRMPWNEQYALETLLTGGGRYRVLLPLYLLWKEHRPELQRLFPRGRTRPHSFWIEKVE
jgi:predicted O-methyltransferase YrrM